MPGLAVGRLVETPAEIAGIIDAYTRRGGVVAPGSSLVTGYDFLADAADAVATELQAGHGRRVDLLITPADKSPQDPASWTAAQLSAKLLGSRHDVIFLAGHFSANSALAADFTTSVLTTELAASTRRTSPTRSSSAPAATAGYNLVDGDAIDGRDAAARLGAGVRAKAARRSSRAPATSTATPTSSSTASGSTATSRASFAPARAPSRSARRSCRRSSTTSRRRPTSAASTRRRCSRRPSSGCRCSASTCPPGAVPAPRDGRRDHARSRSPPARPRRSACARSTSPSRRA